MTATEPPEDAARGGELASHEASPVASDGGESMPRPARASERRVVTVIAREVHVPSRSELIARQLRDQIVSGELAAGDMLPHEPDLMAAFAASKATVREALRILANERLVAMRRGSRGGPVVQAPSQAGPGDQLAALLAYRKVGVAAVEAAAKAVEAVGQQGEGGEVLGAVADVLQHAAVLLVRYAKGGGDAW